MPDLVFFGNEKLATGVTVNSPLRQLLRDKGYEIHEIDKDLEGKEHELRLLKSDIGILVAYGRILTKSILDIFPHGVINIHPSLLPESRGSSPIEETILTGSRQTGVSIMQITQGMDEGPILAQQAVDLRGSETKQELADLLLGLGSRLLVECLAGIFTGKAKLVPQNESKATYTKKISKEDGEIIWNKPAAQIEREIRAYAGWPRSRAKINDIDCIIINADVIQSKTKPGEIKKSKDSLLIGCGDGMLLVHKIQPAGKKPMSGAEFIRGYLK